jgi:phage terminase large subunit-like protein
MEERKARLASLTHEEANAILFDWGFWARPSQKLPPGDWRVWLIRAGRGFGKSRAGAETVRIWQRDFPIVNLIGATADDARDIMVEGESGILAVCPKNERPQYKGSKRQLLWPNGSRSLIFTADEPDRLRGKQHYKIWCDELASWRFPEEAWNQAMLGLRLGSSPQAVVTTTPKPLKLIKELIAASTTHETHGTSYENRVNLAPAFLGQIVTKYEGTRLGRQELNAELLEDNPGALWHHDQIDKLRVEKPPELDRIVIGVDPAVTSTENSAETGIIAAGRGTESPPHFYILGDLSLRGSPDNWAERAVYGYRAHQADRLVGEVNNGGDLVEAVLRTKDLLCAYKAVHASRGKLTRAEPIAALYEQGRVHHVGTFGTLEDQMCDFDPTVAQKSPDRMDALVWALSELSEGVGIHPLIQLWQQEAEEMKAAGAGYAMGQSDPTAVARELARAQTEAARTRGVFGAEKWPSAGTSLPPKRAAPEQRPVCLNCRNRNVSIYLETMRCGVCGWTGPRTPR